MPVKSSTNNRILPANSRAADVAAKTVKELIGAQQQRNYSAFRVQGYEGLLYNRLKQGQKCTCQGSQKHLNSRLGLDGKASPGFVNELLMGQMVFDVTPYGAQAKPGAQVTSPLAPENKYQGVFDHVGTGDDTFYPNRVPEGHDFGDNGPINPDFDIEDLVNGFDASHQGFTDAACCICFGSGFVAGYAPFHALRIVKTVNDVDLGAAEINILNRPWTTESAALEFQTTLPKGAIGIDICRLLNNNLSLNANFTVDGHAVNQVSLLKYCDGRTHTISVILASPQVWTHVELQFILSDQSAYFEFPKLTKGSDTAQLEQLEPFTVLMSSNVPKLRSEDIIVESTFGKTLQVQNSNWWNDKNRNVLGWECQVRVVQPQEIYGILPKRGRIMNKQPTALGQHDNSTGNYRT